MDKILDVLIVGSGFGGSINALRCAEVGKSVLVLERGRRYDAGDFPHNVTDRNTLFWRYPREGKATGLYDLRFFSGLSVLCASGVGGGSLIYANILIRPDASVFEGGRWPSSIRRNVLDRYYDRVEAELGASPLPPSEPILKRTVFHDAAKAVGREVFDPDQAVTWKICKFRAECQFGCQLGAKNTADRTYLARAEKLGVRVQTHACVSHIEPIPEGYRVHYTDTQQGEPRTAEARCLVLSAGTLGTNEILLRSRDVAKTLPGLSSRLGEGFSGNGDFLGSLQNSRLEIEPFHGPDVTSVIRYFDEAPGFTMAAVAFNKNVMSVLASLGQPKGTLMRPFGGLIWRLLDRLIPWAFHKGMLRRPSRLPARNAGDPSRMTVLFAIGQDNANGKMSIAKDRLNVTWNYARENRDLCDRMTTAMRDLGKFYGATCEPLATWNIFRKPFCVHPLGGCGMSDTAEDGVVSPEGEVHGYPRLYIADGSVIPSSIGFHPAMTICAVSERIAESVAAS